jgi:transcriptional regulator with XRE-family HTH domain
MFISKLRERREMLQVTQEMLSDLTGLGLRTIKEMESGKGNPTLKTIQRIAEVLGMELDIKLKSPEVEQ